MDEIIIKDANWNILSNWDTVIAIKDLKVKWAPDIKRGDKFKNIKLTDEEGYRIMKNGFENWIF